MLQPGLVQILMKGHSCLPDKKPAQIFFIQKINFRQPLQRQMLVIMAIHIFPQSVHRPVIFSSPGGNMLAEQGKIAGGTSGNALIGSDIIGSLGLRQSGKQTLLRNSRQPAGLLNVPPNIRPPQNQIAHKQNTFDGSLPTHRPHNLTQSVRTGAPKRHLALYRLPVGQPLAGKAQRQSLWGCFRHRAKGAGMRPAAGGQR